MSYITISKIDYRNLLFMQIDFVEELPKTVSGKIRRVELRNREWGREQIRIIQEPADYLGEFY